jgi:hypothetical protein
MFFWSHILDIGKKHDFPIPGNPLFFPFIPPPLANHNQHANMQYKSGHECAHPGHVITNRLLSLTTKKQVKIKFFLTKRHLFPIGTPFRSPFPKHPKNEKLGAMEDKPPSLHFSLELSVLTLSQLPN